MLGLKLGGVVGLAEGSSDDNAGVLDEGAIVGLVVGSFRENANAHKPSKH